MIREIDLTRQDSSASDRAKNFKAPPGSSATSSNWSKLKDPRIVRVSKAFGGKDRHSKVCTVRGLRDRRVRLSVHTAVQLYDLQDRLGLSQPSKVVDWLLNAAKHEIDELPPLQIPPGSFQPMQLVSQADKQGLKVSGNTSINWSDPLNLKHPSRSGILGGKSEEVSGETSTDKEETNWARSEEEKRFSVENHSSYHVSENSFLPRQNPSSLSSLLNTPIPCNSFIRWDPSNLILSHPPRSNGLMAQPEDWHNFSLVPMSVPSGSHHPVLVYQPAMSAQPYLPPQVAATITGFDPKEMNFQSSRLSTSAALTSPTDSTTQPVGSIHFNTTSNLLRSQDNGDRNEQNKGNI